MFIYWSRLIEKNVRFSVEFRSFLGWREWRVLAVPASFISRSQIGFVCLFKRVCRLFLGCFIVDAVFIF